MGEMQRNTFKIFFLCFAFLLTQKGHAESKSFEKAQNFFYESNKATQNYFKTGKGLEDLKINPQTQFRNPSEIDSNTVASSQSVQTLQHAKPEENTARFSRKALFFSLSSQTVSGGGADSPNYGLSVAISIPVYSSLHFLNSEFQFSGDIKNAGDWGQIQFLQKEAFPLFIINQNLVEVFAGLGFGYGHGSKISSQQKVYAPWATGLQWGKVNKMDTAFYRFEIGWTGDYYFLENNYSQGLLVNLSLGYKL